MSTRKDGNINCKLVKMSKIEVQIERVCEYQPRIVVSQTVLNRMKYSDRWSDEVYGMDERHRGWSKRVSIFALDYAYTRPTDLWIRASHHYIYRYIYISLFSMCCIFSSGDVLPNKTCLRKVFLRLIENTRNLI